MQKKKNHLNGGFLKNALWRVYDLFFVELFPGLEPGTSSLPRKCSTAELKQQLSRFRVVQKYITKMK